MMLRRQSYTGGTQKIPVYLRVYDISNGKAAVWSQLVLRKRIEGIWHTGVHVYGFEYFYGGGINCMTSSQVESSFDMEIVETRLLGYTDRTRDEFERYLLHLYYKFTPETYDLVKWNCNHFSDTCSRFLLDNHGIPDDILNLPDMVASTFLGNVALKLFQRVTQGNNPTCFSPDDPKHPRHEFFPDDQQAKINKTANTLNAMKIPCCTVTAVSDSESDTYFETSEKNGLQRRQSSDSLATTTTTPNELYESRTPCKDLVDYQTSFVTANSDKKTKHEKSKRHNTTTFDKKDDSKKSKSPPASAYEKYQDQNYKISINQNNKNVLLQSNRLTSNSTFSYTESVLNDYIKSSVDTQSEHNYLTSSYACQSNPVKQPFSSPTLTTSNEQSLNRKRQSLLNCQTSGKDVSLFTESTKKLPLAMQNFTRNFPFFLPKMFENLKLLNDKKRTPNIVKIVNEQNYNNNNPLTDYRRHSINQVSVFPTNSTTLHPTDIKKKEIANYLKTPIKLRTTDKNAATSAALTCRSDTYTANHHPKTTAVKPNKTRELNYTSNQKKQPIDKKNSLKKNTVSMEHKNTVHEIQHRNSTLSQQHRNSTLSQQHRNSTLSQQHRNSTLSQQHRNSTASQHNKIMQQSIMKKTQTGIQQRSKKQFSTNDHTINNSQSKSSKQTSVCLTDQSKTRHRKMSTASVTSIEQRETERHRHSAYMQRQQSTKLRSTQLIDDFLRAPSRFKSLNKKLVACPECGTVSKSTDLMCTECGLDLMLIASVPCN